MVTFYSYFFWTRNPNQFMLFGVEIMGCKVNNFNKATFASDYCNV